MDVTKVVRLHIDLNRRSYKELKGKIWTKIVDKDQIDELNKNLNILSTSFNPDNSINIRIYSESKTNKGFKKVDPNLEDVYFITLKENS